MAIILLISQLKLKLGTHLTNKQQSYICIVLLNI